MLPLPFSSTLHHNFYSKSPTPDPPITITLPIILIRLTHYYPLNPKPVNQYTKHYFTPIPLLLPFKLIQQFPNTLTLPFPLYPNIFPPHILLPLLPPLPTNFYTQNIPLPILPTLPAIL
ncbi:F0F1 ATP synthase subunit A, partial [Bacillus sp. WP8]|uniref:F0F1 ATP synthase subunit A n=1 Tax=Bacillus sp. WP8 TaxID=756828 RepID=UPI0037BF3EC7